MNMNPFWVSSTAQLKKQSEELYLIEHFQNSVTMLLPKKIQS